LDERVENLLQAQFKAVKKLLKDHSEALIAVAEALITRDELVADEIKQLIDEADARQVTKEVLSDFEALLGNGQGNGKNGYALVGGNGNGNAPLIERPKAGSSPSTSPLTPNVLDKSALYNEAGEAGSVELPFLDQKRRDL
jgi:hypothetical protein